MQLKITFTYPKNYDSQGTNRKKGRNAPALTLLPTPQTKKRKKVKKLKEPKKVKIAV